MSNQKPPKYMNSRFESKCCDCGATIGKGERIRYLGRSKAQCSQCMPPETIAPQDANAAASPADAWASALGWDDTAPQPGASIGARPQRGGDWSSDSDTQRIDAAQRTGTPVLEVVKPDGRDNCEMCGKLDELSHNDHVDMALCHDCDAIETGKAELERDPIDEKPDGDPLAGFEFSDDERAEALTSELLIILVNAIDVAGITGRHTLAAYCRDQARRSLDMSTRQHVWHGIAQAIDRA